MIWLLLAALFDVDVAVVKLSWLFEVVISLGSFGVLGVPIFIATETDTVMAAPSRWSLLSWT